MIEACKARLGVDDDLSRGPLVDDALVRDPVRGAALQGRDRDLLGGAPRHRYLVPLGLRGGALRAGLLAHKENGLLLELYRE